MRIAIAYPADFPLTGWSKEVFHYRLQHAICRDFFNVCVLEKLRTSRGLVETEESELLREELGAFHCAHFKKMSRALRLEVASKVGQYLGIEIYWRKCAGLIETLMGAGVMFMVLVLGVALGGVGSFLIDEHRNEQRYLEGTKKSSAPQAFSVPEQAAIGQWQSDSEHDLYSNDPEAILSTSLSTKSPAKALRRLVGALQDDGRTYSVKVTVTPAADRNKKNSRQSVQ